MSEENLKDDLKDLSPKEIEELVIAKGQRRFRADQVLTWLYKRRVSSILEMDNLPLDFREGLLEDFTIYTLSENKRLDSKDGAVKIAFALSDKKLIESVLIPEDHRSTLCVSTQVGCRMACRFCRTGQGGFTRNMSPSEIVGQVISVIEKYGAVTNLVFMGMGEPLDNMDALIKSLEILTDKRALDINPRRITVSTVGIADKIPEFGKRAPSVNLALSLHSAVPKTRLELVPSAGKNDLSALRAALINYPLGTKRKITIEYAILGGVNDSPEEALALARFVSAFPSKVNLIPFNESSETGFSAPSKKSIDDFQAVLNDKNILNFVRKSRGSDILAACGQLST